LAQAVRRGEITANAAAVQAGFRKPTWTAPADPERMAAAQATTADVVPMKQGQRTDIGNLPKSQGRRAEAAGISERTQRNLDALARRAPALLDEVRAGRLSAHAAAVQAGIVAPTWTAPADPECRERLIALGAPANGAAAVTLGKQGRPKKADEKPSSRTFKARGTTEAYTVARRDPSLLDEVRAVAAGSGSAWCCSSSACGSSRCGYLACSGRSAGGLLRLLWPHGCRHPSYATSTRARGPGVSVCGL
jgi:hypothetical protein